MPHDSRFSNVQLQYHLRRCNGHGWQGEAGAIYTCSILHIPDPVFSGKMASHQLADSSRLAAVSTRWVSVTSLLQASHPRSPTLTPMLAPPYSQSWPHPAFDPAPTLPQPALLQPVLVMHCLCHAMPCYVMLCHVYAMLCHAMSCLCHAMPCYVMLHCVASSGTLLFVSLVRKPILQNRNLTNNHWPSHKRTALQGLFVVPAGDLHASVSCNRHEHNCCSYAGPFTSPVDSQD